MHDFPSRNLDASLNRASEGLRVLMDLARFGLDASRASAELKSIRHELIQIMGTLPGKPILESRDSAGDVGRPPAEVPAAPTYADESELFEANCRRVQEALRSLEESLRLVAPARRGKSRLSGTVFTTRRRTSIPLFLHVPIGGRWISSFMS